LVARVGAVRVGAARVMAETVPSRVVAEEAAAARVEEMAGVAMVAAMAAAAWAVVPWAELKGAALGRSQAQMVGGEGARAVAVAPRSARSVSPRRCRLPLCSHSRLGALAREGATPRSDRLVPRAPRPRASPLRRLGARRGGEQYRRGGPRPIQGEQYWRGAPAQPGRRAPRACRCPGAPSCGAQSAHSARRHRAPRRPKQDCPPRQTPRWRLPFRRRSRGPRLRRVAVDFLARRRRGRRASHSPTRPAPPPAAPLREISTHTKQTMRSRGNGHLWVGQSLWHGLLIPE